MGTSNRNRKVSGRQGNLAPQSLHEGLPNAQAGRPQFETKQTVPYSSRTDVDDNPGHPPAGGGAASSSVLLSNDCFADAPLDSERTCQLGWLLYSSEYFDRVALAAEIHRLTGVRVGLRWQQIKGSFFPEQQQVYALHLEIDAQASGHDREKLFTPLRRYKNSADSDGKFPFGHRLLLISPARRITLPDVRKAVRILYERQAYFNQTTKVTALPNWDVKDLNERKMGFGNRSLRELIMRVPICTGKYTVPLFLALADSTGNDCAVHFVVRSNHEAYARSVLDNLLSALRSQLCKEEGCDIETLKLCFSPEAVQRADRYSSEPAKKVIVHPKAPTTAPSSCKRVRWNLPDTDQSCDGKSGLNQHCDSWTTDSPPPRPTASHFPSTRNTLNDLPQDDYQPQLSLRDKPKVLRQFPNNDSQSTERNKFPTHLPLYNVEQQQSKPLSTGPSDNRNPPLAQQHITDHATTPSKKHSPAPSGMQANLASIPFYGRQQQSEPISTGSFDNKNPPPAQPHITDHATTPLKNHPPAPSGMQANLASTSFYGRRWLTALILKHRNISWDDMWDKHVYLELSSDTSMLPSQSSNSVSDRQLLVDRQELR